jgi:hypothetical protein
MQRRGRAGNAASNVTPYDLRIGKEKEWTSMRAALPHSPP